MKVLSINRLYSGGLITNYFCTSRCRHCLYGCSPEWDKKYITKETAAKNFEKIMLLGCHCVHIGGGEPFLRPEELLNVLEAAREVRIGLDYIETNSSWFKDETSAVKLLSEYRKLGLTTLLVSISPFHNEFIPFEKVKGIMAACRKVGLTIFPWSQEFFSDLDVFDNKEVHSLDEFTKRFGNNYMLNIPLRYWMHYGGRALQTYKELFPPKPLDNVLSNKLGCRELSDTSHFHIDLFENYIPGLCSGLAISANDLGKPLKPAEYPIICMLFENGINGLLKMVRDEYGFEPAERYFSKCHLCYEIRKFLVADKQLNSPELQPVDFYTHVEG